MYYLFANHSRTNDDFNVAQFGYRDCMPSFRVYHKIVRNYLLHYVYAGKGTYTANGKTYNVAKNQAFLAFPGQEIWYTADEDDPFTYRWVEFYGDMAFEMLSAAGISAENPIMTDAEPFECGEILKSITEAHSASGYKLTGLFWLFANSLVKNRVRGRDNAEELFKKALHYIHMNISKPTTVEEVADSLGVTRGYLTRLFARFIDMNPKQYIAHYHINEVRSLLSGTDMPIGEIARATGYDNAMALTRAFKRLYGMSPTKYRKEVKIV